MDYGVLLRLGLHPTREHVQALGCDVAGAGQAARVVCVGEVGNQTKTGRKPAKFSEGGRKLAATYTPERCAELLDRDPVGLQRLFWISQGKGKTRRKVPKPVLEIQT